MINTLASTMTDDISTKRNQVTDLRIAVVVQRYGEEVNGGAEQMARWLAEHLLQLAEVEVITTCALHYTTWADFYPSGVSELNGVRVRRFPVDKPRAPDLEAKTRHIRFQTHTVDEEIAWIREQGPYSSSMLAYIEDSQEHFDFFLFVTYLYAPTFFGVPRASGKAILIPTAHAEWTIELPAFRPLFQKPELIIYMTEPEREHVHRLMGGEHAPGVVVGIGVDTPADVSAARFRTKYGLEDDFVIYIGRIDEGKNVPEMLAHFSRYQEAQGRQLKLVLLGKAHIPLPQRPDILPLGFVSEQEKYDALQAATLLLMPSKYESLSIVALEAWLMETPVLVNGRCEVLKYQCRKSNGGLYFHTYDEFALTLSTMLDDPALRQSMGRRGARFVKNTYAWPIVLAKYRAIIETLSGRQQ